MGLLYIDRTRYETGLAHCMRDRYLGYHFMEKGISRKGTSVPLATGSYVHEGLEGILVWCKDQQQAGKDPDPPDGIVRESCESVLQKYTLEIDELGWSDIPEAAEEVDYIVEEQCTLTAGLIWCWRLALLPNLLREWEIVAVEEEFELILDCTCGLASVGEVKDHEERNCNGIVLMTRPDLIVRHIETGHLAYIEFKTGADVVWGSFDEKFKDNIQFALGCAAAERALDEPISKLYVHGLHKGSRKSTYDKYTGSWGPRRQESPLCYAYYKPANPPMTKMDLSPTYYKQVDGKNWGCTENRGYSKLPVWDIPMQGQLEGVPYYEEYIKSWDPALVARQVKEVGPMDNPAFLVEKLLNEMVMEERRWEDRLDILDRHLQIDGWASDETQDALEALVPRSWDCKRYGSPCGFVPICFEKEGWDEPLKSGLYVPRTLNHPIEGETVEADYIESSNEREKT